MVPKNKKIINAAKKRNATAKVNHKVLSDAIRPYEGTEKDIKAVTGKGKTGDPQGNGHTPKGKS